MIKRTVRAYRHREVRRKRLAGGRKRLRHDARSRPGPAAVAAAPGPDAHSAAVVACTILRTDVDPAGGGRIDDRERLERRDGVLRMRKLDRTHDRPWIRAGDGAKGECNGTRRPSTVGRGHSD